MRLHVAACLSLVLAAAAAAQEANAPLDTLVASERAFARLSGRIGQAPAFLAYFGDDVVTFQPTPTRGRTALRERAATSPVPPTQLLDWEPWVADISRSGDLGYTTGPVLISDAATGNATGHGWYFSMWQRDATGWRVTADIGIAAPAVGALRPRVLATGDALPGAPPPAREGELRALERRLSAQAASSGLSAAYQGRLAPSVRLYRNGMAPLQGAEQVLAYLGKQVHPPGWDPLEVVTSRGHDLAYCYGLFNPRPAGTAGSAARPAFLHVWKRGSGGWLLVADVISE